MWSGTIEVGATLRAVDFETADVARSLSYWGTQAATETAFVAYDISVVYMRR